MMLLMISLNKVKDFVNDILDDIDEGDAIKDFVDDVLDDSIDDEAIDKFTK